MNENRAVFLNTSYLILTKILVPYIVLCAHTFYNILNIWIMYEDKYNQVQIPILCLLPVRT